jgi:hypothetical protein
MENAALLILLESVLGKGQKTSRGNYAFICPFHTSNPPGKKNFEIQLNTNEKNENKAHCWGCDAKFKTIRAIFRKLKTPPNKLAELNMIIVPGKKEEHNHDDKTIELPKEFISLYDITQLDKLTQSATNFNGLIVNKRLYEVADCYYNAVLHYLKNKTVK